MSKTVLVLFDNMEHARHGVDALYARGFARERIEIQRGETLASRAQARTGDETFAAGSSNS